jgi:hypothetical protein
MGDRTELDTAYSRIRELNIALGLDPGSDPVLAGITTARSASVEALDAPPDDPLRASAWYLHRYWAENCAKIEQELYDHTERVDRYRKDRDAASRDEVRQLYDEIIAYEEPAITLLQGHLDVLKAKMGRLDADPASMFLPLGTVVRFTDAGTYRLSGSFMDHSRSYPVPGSVGVVTGLKRNAEFPIAVSMRRPFKDGYGYAIDPQEDRMPTFLVDPEKVQVVAHGTFPDGSPCLSYGYIATHRIADEWKERYSSPRDRQNEMVIEADGFFWRLHDFGGKQSIECLQAYRRLEEMPWVGEPIVADGPEAGSSGPSR